MNMHSLLAEKPGFLKAVGIVLLDFDVVHEMLVTAFSGSTSVKLASGSASVELVDVEQYLGTFHAGLVCRSTENPQQTLIFSAKPDPLYHLLTAKLPWQFKTWAAHFYWWSENPRDHDYSVGFDFVSHSTGAVERHVRVAREDDGRLVFSQMGLAQSFEEPSHYIKRKVTERLKKELLFDYARSLGVEIMEELRSVIASDSLTFTVKATHG
jgi:hypothetical protein